MLTQAKYNYEQLEEQEKKKLQLQAITSSSAVHFCIQN